LNIVAIDLTSEIHYISIDFNGKKYHLEFNEENRAKRNDWENKIQVIKTHEPSFDFAKCDRLAYAAGPGSYTGARLAYTFLQTIKLITGIDFLGVSNLAALCYKHKNHTPIIKGSKKDIFYSENDKDLFTEDISKIENLGPFVVLEDQNFDFEGMAKVKKGSIVRNILAMTRENIVLALPNNHPNYIKELAYKRINE
tara:strand:- start:1439 stop:2029 length:591 start_codon:yes stop_codon:yes gene_type:complete